MSDYKVVQLGTVTPRKFDQLLDVNMAGVADGNLVAYAASTKTFVPYVGSGNIPPNLNISNINVSGVSTFGGVTISNGIITSSNPGFSSVVYYGDGSKLTGIVGLSSYVPTAGFSTFSNTTYNIFGGQSGNLVYQSSSGVTTFVSNGTSGQVLTFNGSIPQWQSFIAPISGINVFDEGNLFGTVLGLNFVGNSVSVSGVGSTAVITINTGISSYATTAGFATISGIASYSNLSGYSTSSGISSYSNISGYSTFSGISSYSSTSGIATYSTSSGVANTSYNISGGHSGNIIYQISPGISSFLPNGVFGQVLGFNGGYPAWQNISAVSGGTGISIYDENVLVGTSGSISALNFTGTNVSAVVSPVTGGISTITINDNLVATSLTVSGISTFNSSVSVAGSFSATEFYGSGKSLTGVLTESRGLRIFEEDNIVGSGYTFTNLNFVGDNVTVSGIGTTAIITINSGVVGYSSISGIATYSSISGYSTFSGISTFANVSEVATYANNSGFSTVSGISSYAIISGLSTYSTFSGIATYSTIAGYSTTSGIATFSNTAGVATFANISGYSTSSGIATFANVSGITSYSDTAGYSTTSGIATFANVSGITTFANISGYSTTSGIATFSNNAGIATNVIGGIGSIINLNVSGIITTVNIVGSDATITNLGVSSSLILPSSAPTVTSARMLYTTGDRLRYRNTSNNEDELLNSSSNLINVSDSYSSLSNLLFGSNKQIILFNGAGSYTNGTGATADINSGTSMGTAPSYGIYSTGSTATGFAAISITNATTSAFNNERNRFTLQSLARFRSVFTIRIPTLSSSADTFVVYLGMYADGGNYSQRRSVGALISGSTIYAATTTAGTETLSVSTSAITANTFTLIDVEYTGTSVIVRVNNGSSLTVSTGFPTTTMNIGAFIVKTGGTVGTTPSILHVSQGAYFLGQLSLP
jgi:hypothetical protein